MRNKVVPDKIDTLKIPFPFYVEKDDEFDDVFFDYRIKTITKGNSMMERQIKKIANRQKNQSKFYNKILEIKTETES